MKKRRKAETVAAKPGDVSSAFDPMGSYTGRPADPNDKPVQDADDL